MRNKTALFILMICLFSFCQAQEETGKLPGKKRGQYSLDISVGGGAAYYMSVKGIDPELRPTIQKWSAISSVRLIWNPDHRIKFGLETGKMRFLSYDFKDSIGQPGKIMVNAVPLLAEWSMALTRRLNVYAGSGVYFLQTRMNYAGEVKSNKLSIGWMAAVSFIQPLNRNLSIAPELKWMDAAETTDGALALQLQLIYKLIKW